MRRSSGPARTRGDGPQVRAATAYFVPMTRPAEKNDGWEQREALGNAYWEDPRWDEVRRLRTTGKPDDHAAANRLVFEIRSSWGVD